MDDEGASKEFAARCRTADELEHLLEANPSEEGVHSFFMSHPEIFGLQSHYHADHLGLVGLLSKFPIAPDRVPDFTIAALRRMWRKSRSTIVCVELKRPSSTLFAQHNRMSRELNDAWMECMDALRLLAQGYEDVVRRIVARIETGYVTQHAQQYEGLDQYEEPHGQCRIIIGRQAALGTEDVQRIKRLGLSTSGAIAVMTYDTILNSLRAEHPYFQDWYSSW